MKRLCFLAVAAAVIALSEAANCPILGDGEKKILPHDTDCYKYYECTKAGGKQEKDCPGNGSGKWCFDKSKLECVLPTVNCCREATPGDGDDCPNNSKCKMYFSDDVLEVCVKKTTTDKLSKFY